MVFGVSRAAYRAGGIVAVYGAAAAMITANAIAFYLLMRRVSLEEPSRQAGRPRLSKLGIPEKAASWIG